MADTTGIAWTRSTFNPWIGCTEVSPGCDHCYARELDIRYRWGGATHWGAGTPRHRTSASLWAHPLKWERAAIHELETGRVQVQSPWRGAPGFWPVFPSLCDPFDTEVPAEWRADFFRLIRATPHLTWQLLTKRIGNVARMHPGGDYPNVWIGASIVNQEEADRDVTKLLQVQGFARRFISYEPALGPVDFGLMGTAPAAWGYGYCAIYGLLDQIIVGGESRQGAARARPFDIQWAHSAVRQCKEAGVAVFVKQLGSTPFNGSGLHDDHCATRRGYPCNCPSAALLVRAGMLRVKDRAGADPSEWPADLRVREFPA